MTREEELRVEREADDRWTGPRLVILGIVTLGIGLSIIYFAASASTPY
jgi:hypothetical protein